MNSSETLADQSSAAPKSRQNSSTPTLSHNISQSAAWFCAFMAFYAMALLAALGKFAFVGPDEPRYAQIAREMFLSGDYVSPHLSGLLWFEKPVLFYWLAASSYHFFGVSEFAARLPSALLSLLAIGFVFYGLRRSGWTRWGIGSALVLATSALWLVFSFAASTDMVLSSTLCLALLSGFLASTGEGKSRIGFLGLCAVFTAAAMLAKGLIGVFLVVAILGIYVFWTRRAILRSGKDVFLALAIFVVVAGSWYVPVTLRNGSVFIDEFFVNQHFKRYLTDKYQHAQPIYYYIFVACVGALPWIGFIWPALQRFRSLRPRQSERDALLAFAWVWFLVPLAFFSFSTSKLPGYILPIFPALAILLGAEIERLWNGEKTTALRGAAVFNALSVAILGVAGLAMRNKPGFFSPLLQVLFVALILLGVTAIVMLRKGRVLAAFAPALAILGALTTMIFVLPVLSSHFTLGEYATKVAAQLKPNEKMAFYRADRQYAHVFYSGGRVVYYQEGAPIQTISSGDDVELDSRNELIKALRLLQRDGQKSLVIVTRKIALHDLSNNRAISAQLLAQHDNLMAFRVQLKTPTH